MNIRKDAGWIMIAAIAAAILIFFLNLEFFWKNIAYYFWDFRSPTIEQAVSFDKQPQALEPDILVVESLDINAPIRYVDKIDESAFQKALEQGVVHYPGTASPGEPGNVYLFGHSSDNVWAKGSYKTVFAVLPKIEIGAEIRLSDHWGHEYKYKIFESLAVSPRALEYLSQDTKGRKILTLQTSYPIGTSFRRWIVRAELVE